jgi:hypothetical protein
MIDGTVVEDFADHRLRRRRGQRCPPHHGVPLRSKRRTKSSPTTMNSEERSPSALCTRGGE